MDFISYLSIYIPALAGIFAFRGASSALRLIILYVWLTMILEIGVDYLKWRNLNNLFLFHIHTYIEFVFISVLFGNMIKASGKRIAFNVIVFLFFTGSLLLLFLHQDIFEFNSVQRHIEGFLVTLILCFFLFEGMVRKDIHTPKPMIHLSWMLLFYFNGNLFLFIFANQLFEEGKHDIWIIHGILNIMLNLVFAYTIVAMRNNKVSKIEKQKQK